jgi:hypothetical protein
MLISRNLKAFTAASILAVLVTAGALFQQEPVSDKVVLRSPVPDAVASEPTTLASEPPPRVPIANGRQEGHGPAPQNNVLLDRYNAGTQMRELLAHALRNPQDGGHFYASTLLTYCRGVANLTGLLNGTEPSPEVAADPQRLAAAAVVRNRCGEFVESEYSGARDDDLRRTGLASGDPLFKAVAGFRLEDTASRAEAIERILSTKDPVLINDLGPRLAIRRKDERMAVRFDGVDYLPAALRPGLALQCRRARNGVALRGSRGLLRQPVRRGQASDDTDSWQLRRGDATVRGHGGLGEGRQLRAVDQVAFEREAPESAGASAFVSRPDAERPRCRCRISTVELARQGPPKRT